MQLKRISKKGRIKMLPSQEVGELLFGQLHELHQAFFDDLYKEHNRVSLRDLPHYIFWRDNQDQSPEKSLYYNYLQVSWNYYFPSDNSKTRRLKKIQEYKKLKKDIEKNGVKNPVRLLTAPDGRKVLLDGNHRASIAYHLGMDLPYREEEIKDTLLKAVLNEKEFYGTKNGGKPYQSILYKNKTLLGGRRTDILERFKKVGIVKDIRGKTVADIGSNISMTAMLSWNYGAKQVTAMEFSPKIASTALRLSTILDTKLTLKVQDLGVTIKKPVKYDTVFCLSLDAHVKDRAVLERNILAITGNVLYLEGHERRTEADYAWLLRHFKKVELIGFNRDGIHSDGSTRPFFRCVR